MSNVLLGAKSPLGENHFSIVIGLVSDLLKKNSLSNWEWEKNKCRNILLFPWFLIWDAYHASLALLLRYIYILQCLLFRLICQWDWPVVLRLWCISELPLERGRKNTDAFSNKNLIAIISKVDTSNFRCFSFKLLLSQKTFKGYDSDPQTWCTGIRIQRLRFMEVRYGLASVILSFPPMIPTMFDHIWATHREAATIICLTMVSDTPKSHKMLLCYWKIQYKCM